MNQDDYDSMDEFVPDWTRIASYALAFIMGLLAGALL